MELLAISRQSFRTARLGTPYRLQYVKDGITKWMNNWKKRLAHRIEEPVRMSIVETSGRRRSAPQISGIGSAVTWATTRNERADELRAGMKPFSARARAARRSRFRT
jgi:hypothetical protein